MKTHTGTHTKATRASAESFEDAASVAFDRCLQQHGLDAEHILKTAAAILDGLQKTPDTAVDRFLEIAKASALASARNHGNIIETGRMLLGGIESLSQRFGLCQDRARDQVLLGLAEASCQVGPVVYSRFLDVACEFREDAEVWLRTNRRQLVDVSSLQLPIIVPYLDETRIEPSSPSAYQENSPAFDDSCPTSLSSSHGGWSVALELKAEPETASPMTWSKPVKQRSIFRRFSDVLGQLFSGSRRD